MGSSERLIMKESEILPLNNRVDSSAFLSWLNRALFDLDSRIGRVVNITSMLLVVFSVGISMFSTLQGIPAQQRIFIEYIELTVTVIFGIEYILRLMAAHKPMRYALSFYGLIDLLTWVPLLLFGDMTMAIRLLRIMRLLKLIRYLRALHLFLASIQDVVDSLLVVVCGIIIIILITGNLIHLVEPQTFPDAFIGSWWGLVTMTTVGYGDVVPETGIGKFIAACLMISGITLFAMLTATISVKITSVIKKEDVNEYVCKKCGCRDICAVEERCESCGYRLLQNNCYCPNCGKDVVNDLNDDLSLN